ncbi:hypothetical protein [Microbacterium sp. p3-SID131]|uniref:DUF7426 family protein n=1 Tax=Microbacterium sp. p3-SID131 TaxID=2916215 RepID=UPI0021A43448|nr:hypothetical protein [Microbacterium sp. p3-SID131]MCT1363968.1 hypothetical protein [Microbacterium sp. p3-SID131]
MASASDFAAWAQQDLVIPFGGKTYRVAPPDVDRAGKLLACAIRGEVNLGITKGPIPDEVQAVLDTIGPDEHPALGDVHQEMLDDKLSPTTIDRFTYYAVFYWARGEEYADALARLLFMPRVTDDNLFPDKEDEAAPKAS